MNSEQRLALRQIKEKAKRVASLCRDNIELAEWWAENRPSEPPLDCEGDRVLLAMANDILKLIEQGKHDDLTKITARMLRQAEANAGREPD